MNRMIWPSFFQVVEHRLQPLLELAAELGARRSARPCPGSRRLPRRPSGTSPLTMRWARPRRSRSCRRPARRSAPGCSWSGAAAPGWCGGSPRRGRPPGRACRFRRARSGRWCISPAPGARLPRSSGHLLALRAFVDGARAGSLLAPAAFSLAGPLPSFAPRAATVRWRCNCRRAAGQLVGHVEQALRSLPACTLPAWPVTFGGPGSSVRALGRSRHAAAALVSQQAGALPPGPAAPAAGAPVR